MELTTRRAGRRTYFDGDTFSARKSLRDAGAHWDPAERAWWVGDDAKARALVAEVVTTDPADARLECDRGHILGRATYHDRSYYLVGEGESERGEWVRLMFTDGSKTFFTQRSEIEIVKIYRSMMSLADLREFAARRARERKTGICECACHDNLECECPRYCPVHFDGCSRCGCEN